MPYNAHSAEKRRYHTMTSKQFQNLAARFLEEKGYSVSIPSRNRDYGVDLLAQKGDKTLGVQVRLYKNGYNATYQNILNLFAGSRYLDCNGGLFITNTAADSEAHEVARKLHVAIIEGWAPKSQS